MSHSRPQIRRGPPMRPLRTPREFRPRAQARGKGDRLDAHIHEPPGELLQQARALHHAREVQPRVREFLHGLKQGGPGGVGRARARQEAQSGGGFELPTGQSRGGMGPEHRAARDREDFGVHAIARS